MLTTIYKSHELLARIRALLRRESAYKKSTIEIENLTVDLATHQVQVNNTPVELIKKEFEHFVLTRYQLNDHINQDFNSLKSSNLVDVHIKNLRKNLSQ